MFKTEYTIYASILKSPMEFDGIVPKKKRRKFNVTQTQFARVKTSRPFSLAPRFQCGHSVYLYSTRSPLIVHFRSIRISVSRTEHPTHPSISGAFRDGKVIGVIGDAYVTHRYVRTKRTDRRGNEQKLV